MKKISDKAVDIRDAFFDALYDIASNDKNVILLTADMGAFSLEKFRKDLPSQFINMGIAEQNLISVAAGLTLAGKKVFVYGITSFVTQRCFEQIKVDLCGMGLPVTIIGIGGGIAYSSDGLTHQAVQDTAILRTLPDISIVSPSDYKNTINSAYSAYENKKGPVYIRLDKGIFLPLYDTGEKFKDGVKELKKGKSLLIISTGIMVHQMIKAVEKLKEYSIEAGVLDLYRIKPLNEALILNIIDNYEMVVTVEEHTIIGGIGSILSELITDNNKNIKLKRFAIGDYNLEGYGSREWMHEQYGIDIESTTKKIFNWLKEFN